MTDGQRNAELLVLLAQLGDRDAMQQFLQSITPRVARYVRMIARDQADADDAIQETLLIVWRKLQWLQEPAYLNAWLYRIAGREALRAASKRSGQIQLDETEWERIRQRASSHDDTAKNLELLDSVQDLPPAARAVLSLHYLEGLTIEEAAEQLGIPVGTAKSRLSFGIKKLRAQLLGPQGKEIE
jgi:RNA polymerase sigma factor (sigma-70 family)